MWLGMLQRSPFPGGDAEGAFVAAQAAVAFVAFVAGGVAHAAFQMQTTSHHRLMSQMFQVQTVVASRAMWCGLLDLLD